MNKAQIMDAISSAFLKLSEINQMMYDFWLSELYDDEGNLIDSKWNQKTVALMENDIIAQMQVCDAYLMENDHDDSM